MSSDNQELTAFLNEVHKSDGHYTIYHRAIEYYGVNNQVAKSVEELTELNLALCHHFFQGRDCLDSVEEEIADVEIMLAQLRLMVRSEKVDWWKDLKLKRLSENIT